MFDRLIHKYGLKLAHGLYTLDAHWPKPANWGSRVYDWLERHHLCCTRHGYRGGD